jgi:Domain of unknown function (DUF5004)
MKNINNTVSLLLISVLFFSCKPDLYKEIGTPVNNITFLTGNWSLVKVTQTDNDARSKGFPFQVADLTNEFPYSDFKMTFATNGSNPTTFTTTPGNAPRIITLASGNWSVDNIDNPKVITLTSGSVTQTITLGSYPNAISPRLKISLERKDVADKVLITYNYEFVKQ